MHWRAVCRRARSWSRLNKAVRFPVEQLEPRLLLSTYTVTSTVDSGPGTLRDAIANSSADTITVSVTGTITLSSQLEIAHSLTISGPGAGLLSISGNGTSRVFQVDAGAAAEIDGLTITGGHAPDGAAGDDASVLGRDGGNGGAGADGGAVLNLGTLTLDSDLVTDSFAGMGGAGGAGGVGADGGVGGAGGSGGGIYNDGALTLLDDTISGNNAGAGGVGGLTEPRFGGVGVGGGGGGSGGGLFSAGTATLTNCTFFRNTAGAGGVGGASVDEPGGAGGSGGNGGAICAAGPVVLINDTVSQNLPAFGGAGGPGSGGGAAGTTGTAEGIDSTSTLTIGNTLVAPEDVVCAVAVQSLGHNLVGIGTGASGWVSTDLTGTFNNPLEPGLGALSDYGGPLPTMHPVAGSPVINAGENSLVTNPPSGPPTLTDERGLPRIVEGTVDIGAVEFSPRSASLLVVTTSSDAGGLAGQLNLREAVGLANVMGGNVTITFAIPPSDPGYDPATASYRINLTSPLGQLEISDGTGRVLIAGPGPAALIIDGIKRTRVFQVDLNMYAEIDGVTIADGQAPPSAQGAPGAPAGAGVYYSTTGGAAYQGGDGGGILNFGALVLTNDVITANRAGAGGAGGPGGPGPREIPVTGSAGVGGNGGPGGDGGGIYSAYADTGFLSLTNVTLSGNSAGAGGTGGIGGSTEFGAAGSGGTGGVGGSGGAIYAGGTLLSVGTSIIGNSAGVGGLGGNGGGGGSGGGSAGSAGAGGDGGGLETDQSFPSPLSLTASTISNNTAAFGGGIFALGKLIINDTTISGNTAEAAGGVDPDESGGGVYSDLADITFTNCTIADNVPSGLSILAPSSFSGVSIYNTIVAANHFASGGEFDVDGLLDTSYAASQGGSLSSNNLIGGPSGRLQNGTRGNIVGVVDPGLAALGNYGGPTQTFALLAGSPAIDHGSNALAAAAGLTTDQRGYGRIYNRNVDIGAFEFGSALPGDLNHDGAVNFADLLILAQNYGSSNATWEQGDLDGDGTVGFGDLLILAHNFGPSSAGSPAGGSVDQPAGQGPDDLQPRRRSTLARRRLGSSGAL